MIPLIDNQSFSHISKSFGMNSGFNAIYRITMNLSISCTSSVDYCVLILVRGIRVSTLMYTARITDRIVAMARKDYGIQFTI